MVLCRVFLCLFYEHEPQGMQGIVVWILMGGYDAFYFPSYSFMCRYGCCMAPRTIVTIPRSNNNKVTQKVRLLLRRPSRWFVHLVVVATTT